MTDEILPSLPVETPFGYFNYEIAFWTVTVCMIVAGLGWWLGRRLQNKPGRRQAAAELLVGFFDKLCRDVLGPDRGRKYLPLFGSLFLFICLSNVVGFVPVNALTGRGVEIGGEEYVDFFPIIGGSTVTLRSLHLLRILGFHKIEIFGFDSCIVDEHHAYPQPENDDEQEVEITVGGRQFRCTVAHYFQAKEFVQLIGATGANYELSVHGEGLISHIIKHPESLKEAA